MESDDLRKLLKRIAVIAAFFLLGLLLYLLGGKNHALARRLLLAYALVVGLVMVLAILLQSGRGGGLAGLGGLSGESLLGAHSATPIAKATYVMGALLLFLCMLMARLGGEAPPQAAGTLEAGGEPLVEETGAGIPRPDGANQYEPGAPGGPASGEDAGE